MDPGANKSRNTNQSRLLWVQFARSPKLSESAAPEIIEISDANIIEHKLICSQEIKLNLYVRRSVECVPNKRYSLILNRNITISP